MEQKFENLEMKEIKPSGNHFLQIGGIIRHRYGIILLVFGVFIAGTLLYNLSSKQVYKTQFIISLSANETIMGEGNSQIFFKQIMQPEELEKDIRNYNLIYNKFKMYKPLKSRIISDEINNNLFSVEMSPVKYTHAVEVLLFVYDTSAIRPITNDLLQYLNGNEYLQRELSLERTKLQVTYDSLNKQLSEMRATTGTYNLSHDSHMDKGYFDIYKDIADLQNRTAEVDIRIKKLNGYEISVPPLIPVSPYGLKLWQSLLIFGLIGIIAGMLIAYFIEKISRQYVSL